MPNYNYKFAYSELTKEQVEFFLRVHAKSVNVLFSEFGDATKFDEFRRLTSELDEVFGAGATEASSDVNTTGYTHFDASTREVLSLVSTIVELRTSGYLENFFRNQEHLGDYYDRLDIVGLIRKYELNEEDYE
jgi:hypothetical protein